MTYRLLQVAVATTSDRVNVWANRLGRWWCAGVDVRTVAATNQWAHRYGWVHCLSAVTRHKQSCLWR